MIANHQPTTRLVAMMSAILLIALGWFTFTGAAEKVAADKTSPPTLDRSGAQVERRDASAQKRRDIAVLQAQLNHQDREHALADSHLKAAYPGTHARLNQQITALERESIDESLKELADVNLFYWPGGWLGREFSFEMLFGEELNPLGTEVGQFDIDSINSNRRFCKIVEALSKLDVATASKKVNHELESATVTYLGLYESEMQKLVPLYK